MLAVLLTGPSLVPSTYVATVGNSAQVDPTPSTGLLKALAHTQHSLTETHTHKINPKRNTWQEYLGLLFSK